ncbi:Retrovirus-related Pol polyprotein from transposon 297 [Vitis vinifera]|uniref:Retrovirus-related Pol polyprotein from transposon 297 n=1 Tax=Vitis vinifera TaxID=29760 RepID=A0A438HJJ2_VITVI|nr:Retrovirus-related Pol polyprotein from transposon 297 [Vitis vinifera]
MKEEKKLLHSSVQVLERVSGHPFYYFLDRYSGYFQIEIDIEDQEKTTFTCSFGTYAYRRMPFGLCNAPATFQRCMLSIFSDMVEQIMEVFIDDITIYGGFYRRFIQDFSKLSRPLCELLAKDAKSCTWPKRRWEALCDLLCKQNIERSSKNYITTEKELLAVVFALDKFRAYLVGSFIIVFTDHSALKYLLTKQDAKARLAITHNSHVLPINDDFPEESLMMLEKAPWYAHIANYLVTGEVPSEWKAQDRKHFFAKIHAYYWEEPFLFKYCADQIIRKCVLEEEQQGILSHCHENGMWRPLCLSENNHEGLAIRVYLAIAFQRFAHHV